jgi:hypothetical protein
LNGYLLRTAFNSKSEERRRPSLQQYSSVHKLLCHRETRDAVAPK